LIYTFQPIFTALFAWLLLGETMGPAGVVGGSIIAASVYIVASPNFAEGATDSMSSLLEKNKTVDLAERLNSND
jgi:drug/metabolite transporter (DMT)-like permease